MANTLTALIPKILGRSILTIREKVVLARTVASDFSSEVAQYGTTIDFATFPDATTSAVVPGPVDPTPSNVTPSIIQLTLDNWRKSDFHLTDKELMEIDANATFIPGAMAQAIRALANYVNIAVHGTYTGVYGLVGTPGTTPFATDASAAINARKLLAQQHAPKAPRFGIVDADAEANMLALATFADAEKTGENGVKIDGEIGRKYGFDWAMDDHISTHTTVAAGTPLIDSAGAYALGVKTIHMDGLTTAPGVGDIFTWAGDAQQYVVVSSTALVGTDSDVTFEPGLKVAKPAADGNEVVTFVATHVVNLVYHPDAIALAMRPIRVPANRTDTMMSMTDPETGLSFTLTILDQYHQLTWELSALFGVKLIRPEYAVRIAG